MSNLNRSFAIGYRPVAVSEFLGHVRSVTLEAYSNQDLPFEKLVEEINPRRDGRRCPLVRVMFSLDNTSGEPLRLHGLEVEPFDTPQADAEFDRILSLTENDGAISGCVTYSTHLFDRDTICCMIDYYKCLLRCIAENPDCMVDRLPILTKHEFV